MECVMQAFPSGFPQCRHDEQRKQEKNPRERGCSRFTFFKPPPPPRSIMPLSASARAKAGTMPAIPGPPGPTMNKPLFHWRYPPKTPNFAQRHPVIMAVVAVLAVAALGAAGFAVYHAHKLKATPPANNSYLAAAFSNSSSSGGAVASISWNQAQGLRLDAAQSDTVGNIVLADETTVRSSVSADVSGGCQWYWVRDGGVLQRCNGAWSYKPPSQAPKLAGAYLLLNAPTVSDADEMLYSLALGSTHTIAVEPFVSAQ